MKIMRWFNASFSYSNFYKSFIYLHLISTAKLEYKYIRVIPEKEKETKKLPLLFRERAGVRVFPSYIKLYFFVIFSTLLSTLVFPIIFIIVYKSGPFVSPVNTNLKGINTFPGPSPVSSIIE